MTLGEAIYFYRQQRGLTQEDLAAAVGTTPQNIYKYEKGIVTSIPLWRVEEIAKVLHVPPSVLVGWEDDVPATYGPTASWVDIYTEASRLPDEQQEIVGQAILSLLNILLSIDDDGRRTLLDVARCLSIGHGKEAAP